MKTFERGQPVEESLEKGEVIAGRREKFFVDGLRGREIYGRIFTESTSDVPQIAVSTADDRLGFAVATASSKNAQESAAGMAEWAFTFRIPDALYDADTHKLVFEYAGAKRAFSFVGDPMILLPKKTRARAAAKTAIDLPGAENLQSTVTQTLLPQALVAVMSGLQAQTQALQFLVQHRSIEAATGSAAPVPLVDRYGGEMPDAALKTGAGQDFVWLGIIDWHFRTQRPQHLASHIADAGHRVFYISITFEPADGKGRFRVASAPHAGVYEIRLRLSGTVPKNIYSGFTDQQLAEIQEALDEMATLLHIQSPIVVIQYPSWHRAAAAFPGAIVVHDCLDFLAGFSNVTPEMVELEEELTASADAVVTSSQPLADYVSKVRPNTIVRNAADVEFFAKAADKRSRPSGRRPVVGYFGAISEWYEIKWVEKAARAHPEWDFVLIGSHAGCDVQGVKALKNVRLTGEVPYSKLPKHLAGFDVAVIPFKLTDLIKCTNPVKLYEYMAAGVPVVASAMPEVVNATDLVYIAEDAEDFGRQIARALQEDTPQLQSKRRAWASRHTWESRAEEFLDTVPGLTPPVSVVVLTYNNWAFTRACLRSVLTLSEYPRLEVIVVDNGSTDETRGGLEKIARHDERVRVILNDSNLGFAAGNNVGLREARGEYVILLNNDTFVTRGWVRDLIRPLQLDPKVGLTGPLTNNIGNEQKIIINYGNMHEMAAHSRRFVKRHFRERLSVAALAFFCVATRRDVLDKVGLLDESYGVGFYEDDDYCKRLAAAGYDIQVVDDVFVHHHLSASFDKLGSEKKKELMERNKAIFEKRWGTWKPHVYRKAQGFG